MGVNQLQAKFTFSEILLELGPNIIRDGLLDHINVEVQLLVSGHDSNCQVSDVRFIIWAW